jgi:hypothetical protein
VFFHISGAQIKEGIRKFRIKLGGFVEFSDLDVDLVLVSRSKPRLNVLRGAGRSTLAGKPCQQK